MRAGTGAGMIGLLLLAGCASAPPPPPVSLAAVGEVRAGSGMPRGYLAPSALPDSLALLPPPPPPGSAAQAADDAATTAAIAGTDERFRQAAADADLRWPRGVQGFEAALGRSVSGPATPHTAMLLQRAGIDAAFSTMRAKGHYMRVRPFVVRGVGTCSPADEEALKKDGSYPSGHAAIGWMLALVLVDLAPEKTNALLRRGYDFGESRVFCRAHWQSDVAAGRLMASAAYARLQSDPTFGAQRELARAELARKP